MLYGIKISYQVSRRTLLSRFRFCRCDHVYSKNEKLAVWSLRSVVPPFAPPDTAFAVCSLCLLPLLIRLCPFSRLVLVVLIARLLLVLTQLCSLLFARGACCACRPPLHSETVNISADAATALLRHFSWNRERLFDQVRRLQDA